MEYPTVRGAALVVREPDVPTPTFSTKAADVRNPPAGIYR
jgi:hypothetical protein